MLAADHMPIAAPTVPVAVLIRVPVRVIPIGIGVDCGAIAGMESGAIVGMDNRAVAPSGMISTIGAADSRATSGVDRSAITSLDCRAMAVVSYFAVISLIRVRVKSGGRKGDKNYQVFHSTPQSRSLPALWTHTIFDGLRYAQLLGCRWCDHKVFEARVVKRAPDHA